MKQMYFCPLFCLFFCFLILFWNNYKFILLCMWFVPVPFCIQVTTSRARICVHMCVCVSRFALISNHAHTRTCWDDLSFWFSGIYKWYYLLFACILLKIKCLQIILALKQKFLQFYLCISNRCYIFATSS